MAWNASGISKLEDFAGQGADRRRDRAAADTDQFPRIINGVLGTKIEIVTGYPGGNDVNLAMERGEVNGRCGWSWSSVMSTPRWINEKKVTILMQLSLEKHPDLPDVPLISELAKTEEQQQIFKLIFARQVMGRPYLAPPGVPADRAAALRKAFMDTMKDPEFLAEAEKLEARDHAGVRRRRGAAGEGHLPDAQGARRQGGGIYPALVSRFRSSYHHAAPPFTNFGIEGH